jgi:hypoxia up-regulated 1
MFAKVFLMLAQVALVSSYIMGVDFGSDTMKIALVQSGKPLQIITNFESKRKTPSTIAFYKGERRFGANAVALMPRKPEMVYSNPFRLIGRTPNHPLAAELLSMYFPYDLQTNSTSGLTMVKEGGQEGVFFTPEELTAMLLQHAKDITAAVGEKEVKDCVITVPSSFTQHEREAVFAAAAIADLNVLSLIEENTAAALQYSIDHSPAPAVGDSKTVLFYNLGATTTQVSIVRYSSYVSGKGSASKTVSQLEVIGKGFDTHLGGLHMDVRLAEMLADRFNVEWNKQRPSKEIRDIKGNAKVMSKLRLEANKLKEVLSVNAEYPVKLEQLFDDVALSTKVTRKELEALCEENDFFQRAVATMERAVASVGEGFSMTDVDAVELIGGGFRVPKVKAALEEHLLKFPRTVTVTVPATKAAETKTEGEKKEGEEKETEAAAETKTETVFLELGQHINSDESMALGAAFRGANLSTSFRVRKIGLVDSLNYGVRVKLHETEVEGAAAAEEPWEKQTVVFPARTSLLVKPRTVAFNFDRDISLSVEADTEGANLIDFHSGAGEQEGGNALFSRYDVGGVTAFAPVEATETTEAAPAPAPRVHLTFTLDGQSGIVFLSKAEATLELPKKPTPEPEPELGEEPKEEAKEEEVEKKEADEAKDTEDEATADKKTEEKTEEKTEDKKKKGDDKKKKGKKDKKEKEPDNIIRRTLTITEHRGAVSPPIHTAAQISDSKARLQALDDADNEKKLRESTLNALETEIYKVRNSFRDSDEKELQKVVRAEKMEAVIAHCNDMEEWLYGEGMRADTAAFNAKKAELAELVAPMYKRMSELTALPSATKKARKVLADLRGKVAEWELKSPHILANETEAVLAEISKYEAWLEDRETVHNALSPFGDEDEAVAEPEPEPEEGLGDNTEVKVPAPRRLESKVVTAKLKPVAAIFKKYNNKPVPLPEKVEVISPENATESNETEASADGESATEKEAEPTRDDDNL